MKAEPARRLDYRDTLSACAHCNGPAAVTRHSRKRKLRIKGKLATRQVLRIKIACKICRIGLERETSTESMEMLEVRARIAWNLRPPPAARAS